MRTKLLFILTVCLLMAGIISCDVTGEQNYDFEQGNTLAIVGPESVTIPQDTTTADTTDVTQVTASYYSKAFTIDKDYSWSVSGSAQGSVYREGEYMDVTFTQPGTYTISVDDGEYQGTLEVTATRQSNEDL